MPRLVSLLVIAAAVTGCASVVPPVDNGPALRTLLAAPRGDAELAGQPFDLVQLLEARIGFELAADDAAEISRTATEALDADAARAEITWANQVTGNEGNVLLWRRDAMGDGRTCAILHHEHLIGDGTVRGNVTTCRRGDIEWWLDDWEWVITGADFGGL